MKKPIILTLGLVLTSLFLNAQVYTPNGTVTGTSNDASKVVVGPLISPSSFGAQLLVNTKTGGSNSILNNLELHYSFTSTSQQGGGYVAPSL